MTYYLISFDEGAMDFPDEDLQDVSDAAYAVVTAAKAADVLVYTGGLFEGDPGTVVAVDGSISAGTVGAVDGVPARVAGLAIVNVPTLADAQGWAAKIAVACRCAQDVREFQLDRDARKAQQ